MFLKASDKYLKEKKAFINEITKRGNRKSWLEKSFGLHIERRGQSDSLSA